MNDSKKHVIWSFIQIYFFKHIMLIHTYGAWWTRAIPHHEISPCFLFQEKFTARGSVLAPLNDSHHIREPACYSINRIRQRTAEAEKRKSLFLLLFLSLSLVDRVSVMRPGRRRKRRERTKKLQEIAKRRKKIPAARITTLKKWSELTRAMVITLVTRFPRDRLFSFPQGFVEKERENDRARKRKIEREKEQCPHTLLEKSVVPRKPTQK